ncbi:MAG: glycosyltransferase [Bacteroidia bacterium]
MEAKPKILYVHLGLTTFVKRDMEMLSEGYQLISYAFTMAKKSHLPWRLLHQLWFLLHHIWRTDLVVVQFAGYHGVLPGLLAKLGGQKMLVIASGTESASYPSIHYGNYHKKIYSWFTRWTFRLCHHIAPVHESLMYWENEYYDLDGKEQGIFAHVPNFKRPYTMIPYGYDCQKWATPKVSKKVNTGITVAFIPDKIRYELKGIDIIIKAAASVPEMQFTIVGMSYKPDELIPSNVKILGPQPHDAIHALLDESAFYFQLSISEGHPNALSEGMLKECVPIGSAVTSIPEIISDTGYVLKERSAKALTLLLQKAMQGPWPAMGKAARERICGVYPHSRRANALVELAQKLITDA